MGWGSGREIQEGGDVCIHIAVHFVRIAETNTTLESNYIQQKKKKKEEAPRQGSLEDQSAHQGDSL